MPASRSAIAPRRAATGREHQPPFEQPAQAEHHCHGEHASGRRLGEPDGAERHRRQHDRVARHDVFVGDGEHQHVAAGEVEQRAAQRQQPVGGERIGQAMDDADAERGARRVQDGELPPRIAGQDAQRIEQPAKFAVERVEQVVRGIEHR